MTWAISAPPADGASDAAVVKFCGVSKFVCMVQRYTI
jgi:hypothetical protein